MKRKMLFLISGALILTAVFTAGVFASSHLQQITAYLNGDLKIRSNGVITQLNDANGNAVLPITYEGTTYLPVRAVANVLDVAVHYDAAAYEVVLGERVDGVALNQEHFNNTLYSKEPSDTNYGGKDYGEVLISPAGLDIFRTSLRPEGKYQKIYLQVAAIDENIDFVEIRDHDAKAVLRRVENITTEDGMITIEADIVGVNALALEVRKSRDGGFVIPLTTSYYK